MMTFEEMGETIDRASREIGRLKAQLAASEAARTALINMVVQSASYLPEWPHSAELLLVRALAETEPPTEKE